MVIGDDNLFGENVKIYDHNHIFNNKKANLKKAFLTGEIIIGNRNWICTNCVILKNTKMENNNVISAGNVINEKIDSDNLIKIEQKVTYQKINYK